MMVHGEIRYHCISVSDEKAAILNIKAGFWFDVLSLPWVVFSERKEKRSKDYLRLFENTNNFTHDMRRENIWTTTSKELCTVYSVTSLSNYGVRFGRRAIKLVSDNFRRQLVIRSKAAAQFLSSSRQLSGASAIDVQQNVRFISFKESSNSNLSAF